MLAYDISEPGCWCELMGEHEGASMKTLLCVPEDTDAVVSYDVYLLELNAPNPKYTVSIWMHGNHEVCVYVPNLGSLLSLLAVLNAAVEPILRMSMLRSE